MKIGDYVTVQEVKNQSECRWVVLVDFVYSENGGIEGGTIKYIEDTKVKAGRKTIKLQDKGIMNLLICGAIEPLSVGGVFVK